MATTTATRVTIVAGGQRNADPADDYRSFTNEKAVPHSHAKHSSV
jgi:hypothetical protein